MGFVFQDLLTLPRDQFRLDEVAEACEMSRRSVQRYIRAGKLGAVSTPLGRRIPRAAIMAASPTLLRRI